MLKIKDIKYKISYFKMIVNDKLCKEAFIEASKINPPKTTSSYNEDYITVEYTEETFDNKYKYKHHYAYGSDYYSVEKIEE